MVRVWIAGQTATLNSEVVSRSFYSMKKILANTFGDNFESFKTSMSKGITFLTKVRLSNLSNTLVTEFKN